jgi:hypothetical protein
MSCGASVLNPDDLVEVERENGAAETGTIIHALAEDIVAKGGTELRHHEVRLRELDGGFERAIELLPKIERVWRVAQPSFIEPVLEAYFESDLGSGITITGHIDIHEAFVDHALVLDWKTGRQRVEHYHQVMGYAFLVWDSMGRPEDYVIYPTVVYVEDGEQGIEKIKGVTPSDLEEWAAQVVAKAKDTRYVTSEKCVHCPLANSCPAHAQKRATAVSVISGGAGSDLRQMEDRAEVINKLKIVEDAVKQFKADLKADVKANGPIDLGDGTEYRIEEKPYESLNAAKALPSLGEHGLTSQEVLKATKFSLPQLRKAVYNRAVKGDKSVAVDRLNEDLVAKKALFQSTTSQMWRRKSSKKIDG